MKVRIGVALGGRTAMPLEQFGAVLDDLELLGFDSVWLPETFLGGTVDPVVGLAYAAARVRRLKLGTHIVTPGRPPFALAKALAQLDRLSGGRLLLTFVAGLNDRAERAAQGLPTGDRTKWFDEHLPRIRSWWTGATVDGLTLDTMPQQQPLEVWLGGRWYTFDPRNNHPRVGRVLIGRGRDALDCAMLTSYGDAALQTMEVWADEVTADDGPGSPG